MTETLLDAVRRYAQAHAGPSGIARTPIPGLAIFRATEPSDIQHAIYRPLVCLMLQGTKHLDLGQQAFTFSAGDTLLVTADVPTASRVVEASPALPYLSLIFELDPAVVAALAVEMKAVPLRPGGPAQVEPTDAEVADAALRLLHLLDRPASIPVLQAQHVRELHY